MEGIKQAWGIVYDRSDDYVMGWTDNQIRIPATYDDTTGEFSIQTTALDSTSWHQPNHKFAFALFVEDMAGNIGSMSSDDETYGDQLAIRVLEKEAPVITFDDGYDMYTETSIDLPIFGFYDGKPYERKDGVPHTDPFIQVDQCKTIKESSGINISSAKWYLDGEEFTPKAVKQVWDVMDHMWYDVETELEFKVWADNPAPSEGYSDLFTYGRGYFVIDDSSVSGSNGVTLSDLSAGYHTIKVTIEDNDGNLAEYEHQFMVHTSAPYIEVILPVANYKDYFVTNNSLIHVKARVRPHEDGTAIEKLALYSSTTGALIKEVPFSDLGDPDDSGWYIYEDDVEAPPTKSGQTEFSEYDWAIKSYTDLRRPITISVYDIYENYSSVVREIIVDTSKPWFEDVSINKTTVTANQDKITIKFKLYDLPMYNGGSSLFKYRSTQINPITGSEPSESECLTVTTGSGATIKYAVTANTRRAVDFVSLKTDTPNDEQLQTEFSVTRDPDDPHTIIFEALKETYFSASSAYRHEDNVYVGTKIDSWKIPIIAEHAYYGTDLADAQGLVNSSAWRIGGSSFYPERAAFNHIIVRQK